MRATTQCDLLTAIAAAVHLAHLLCTLPTCPVAHHTNAPSHPPIYPAGQMEESRGGKLRRHLEALQGDLELAAGWNQQMEDVVSTAQQFVADAHRRIAQVGAGQGMGPQGRLGRPW